MTHDAAPRREDARDLQAKLYREIGIAAVAAALQPDAQPDRAPRAPGAVDERRPQPHMAKARAA